MPAKKQFSQEEGFTIINAMINSARNQFTENGYLYLLWGCIVPGYGMQQKFNKQNAMATS